MKFSLQHFYLNLRRVSTSKPVPKYLLTAFPLVITLLRVFTTEDSVEGYHRLFQRAFALIHKISRQPVLFDHLHATGIHGVIVDMDHKQYTGKRFLSTCQAPAKYLGLGRYLSEIDPHHRDINWHLERLIVFCRVHFQRTVLKAIGTNKKGSELWQRMMDLLKCGSAEEYDYLLDLLIGTECFLSTYKLLANCL
jgi:hypothetical protein